MKKFSPPKKILVVALLSLLSLTSRALPFVPTTDPLSSTTHWYQIKTENVYLYADFGDLWATPTASTAEPYLWCFVGDESTGYKILSRSNRYYLTEINVNGIGTESTLDYVELGSGNNFYIAYKYQSQTMYLTYDSDNNGFYGYDTKLNTYTVTEVNIGTLQPMNSAEPELTMTTASDRCVIKATGWGIVTLTVNGNEVESPYTIMRTDVDQQVTVTATLQQPARLPTTVTKTFTIPRLEGVHLPGDVTNDGQVDISDVNAIINIMLGKAAQNAAGDVTNDGAVDIADVNEVINIMLGKNAPKFTEYTVNGVKFKMIDVDGGTFMMGDDSDNGNGPVHQVTLSDYSIGETEVTQELWLAVMGSKPSRIKEDNPLLPIDFIRWYECQDFITRLNELTGKTFSMPTEAQWEYAARGGKKSKGYKYSGSNNVNDVAWYQGTASGVLHPVATKAPNELGIYDMSGNVMEWCQDYYGNYSSEPQTDPTGPTAETASNTNYRIVRGGDFGWDDYFCEVSQRFEKNIYDAEYVFNGTGLRLAMSRAAAEPTVQSLTATGYNTPGNIHNNTDEAYTKLVDGNKNTKWVVVMSGSWQPIYIDLKSSVPFKPTSYILTTGNDTHAFYTRNPKNWKIYGRNSESESWTELAHVTDGTGLGDADTTDYTFQFNGVTKAYQYYRFEVIEIGGKDRWDSNNYAFQLAELTLMGVPAQ